MLTHKTVPPAFYIGILTRASNVSFHIPYHEKKTKYFFARECGIAY